MTCRSGIGVFPFLGNSGVFDLVFHFRGFLARKLDICLHSRWQTVSSINTASFSASLGFAGQTQTLL